MKKTVTIILFFYLFIPLSVAQYNRTLCPNFNKAIPLTSVAIKDSSILALGTKNGNIWLFDLSNGKLKKVLKVFNDELTNIKLGESYIIVNSANKTSLIDVENLSLVNIRKLKRKPRINATLDESNKDIIYIDRKNNICFYNIENKILKKITKKDHLHTGNIRVVKFNKSKKYLITYDGSRIRVWNARTKKQIKSIRSIGSNDVISSPYGNHIAAIDRYNKLRIWKVIGSNEAIFQTDIQNSQTLCFGPNGNSIAICKNDNSMDYYGLDWENKKITRLHTAQYHKQSITGIQYNFYGNLVVTSSLDGTLRIYEPYKHKPKGTLFCSDTQKWAVFDDYGRIDGNDYNSLFFYPTHPGINGCFKNGYHKAKGLFHRILRPVSIPGISCIQTIPPYIGFTNNDFFTIRGGVNGNIQELEINGEKEIVVNNKFNEIIALNNGLNEIIITDPSEQCESKTVSIYKGKGASPKNYALFFAAKDYIDTTLQDLDNPIKDAKKLSALLEDKYGYISTILKNPTKKGIIDQINVVKAIIRKNDNLFIHFIGHGKEGCFLPSDSYNKKGSLSYEELVDLLKPFQNNKILLVLDACYSRSFCKVGKWENTYQYNGYSENYLATSNETNIWRGKMRGGQVPADRSDEAYSKKNNSIEYNKMFSNLNHYYSNKARLVITVKDKTPDFSKITQTLENLIKSSIGSEIWLFKQIGNGTVAPFLDHDIYGYFSFLNFRKYEDNY
jgi:hypothetical protein